MLGFKLASIYVLRSKKPIRLTTLPLHDPQAEALCCPFADLHHLHLQSACTPEIFC